MFCRKKMKYYHVCTDALAKDLLFYDDEDYITGMNYLAVVQFASGVKILAFCIMSNHIHIVMCAEENEIRKFMTSFKRRYAMWLTRKYNERKSLRNIRVKIKNIDTPTYLKQVIVYVLRNPVAARMNINPYKYRWSSANCYFVSDNSSTDVEESYGGTATSIRKKRVVFKSHTKIQGSVRLRTSKIVDPNSFVDAVHTESVFKTLKAFMYFMSKDNDTELEYQVGLCRKIAFCDNTVLKSITLMCKEKFGEKDLHELSIQERCSMIPLLRRNFNSSEKQIARLLGIDTDIIKQFL